MSTDIDLKQLSVDRTRSAPASTGPRRPIFSRYLVPFAVIFGFLGMLGWAARDRFVTATNVTVVPVVVTRAEVQQSGTPLFQAAGWVEPSPTPILVAAQTEGIVSELLVFEGQEIEAGQSVAHLVDTDAKLALEQVHADLMFQQSALASAEAELESAQQRLKHPVHLQASVSEAESALARAEGELARIPYQVKAAQSKHEFAEKDLQAKESAGDALAARIIRQARSDRDSAHAELSELAERPERLKREVEALRARHDALSAQLRLLIEEKRQLGVAQGAHQSAQSRLKQAELAVKAAKLRLERTTINAPISGRVLALVARPGARVMGLDPNAEVKSSTIMTMYNPHQLQVRADVRLEDVPLIQGDQPVEIETASTRGRLKGRVLRATSQANVQKNTLEVKVAIIDPPPTIRPEMLVTATFLAPDLPENRSKTEQPERLLVPKQLVKSEGGQATLWVADAAGIARLQHIKLGKAGTQDLVEVVEGLTPTDRLVSGNREAMVEGLRISISGEDSTLGMANGGVSRQ